MKKRFLLTFFFLYFSKSRLYRFDIGIETELLAQVPKSFKQNPALVIMASNTDIFHSIWWLNIKLT